MTGERPPVGFTPDDVLTLLTSLCMVPGEQVPDVLYEWLTVHAPTKRDAAVFMSVLVDCVITLAQIPTGRFAALAVGDGADQGTRLMGQLLTTAINKDSATHWAVLNAILEGGDRLMCDVVDYLVVAFRQHYRQRTAAGT